MEINQCKIFAEDLPGNNYSCDVDSNYHRKLIDTGAFFTMNILQDYQKIIDDFIKENNCFHQYYFQKVMHLKIQNSK